MDLHINFGRHAGELRDIAPEAALAMLADGRASRPGEELEHVTSAVAEVAPHVVGAVDPAEVQPRRRSRR